MANRLPATLPSAPFTFKRLPKPPNPLAVKCIFELSLCPSVPPSPQYQLAGLPSYSRKIPDLSPQWWERTTAYVLSSSSIVPSAFMFELADTKQEHSEMLNCSTKDQPAMQLSYCSVLLLNTMLQLPIEWPAFSLQKKLVPVSKKVAI